MPPLASKSATRTRSIAFGRCSRARTDKLGDEDRYVGAVEFAPLLLSAPAGLAAGRFDRRALMIVSDAGGEAAVGVLAAAVLTNHARFWLILGRARGSGLEQFGLEQPSPTPENK